MTQPAAQQVDFGFKPKMKALQEFDLPDDLASALPNIVKDQAWEGEPRHFACAVVGRCPRVRLR